MILPERRIGSVRQPGTAGRSGAERGGEGRRAVVPEGVVVARTAVVTVAVVFVRRRPRYWRSTSPSWRTRRSAVGA
ncbi:hypothetical protein LV779_20960 [Streptomyces thinghirensis]|nr:hypothetical protein [Streptomyces thinghirensis]